MTDSTPPAGSQPPASDSGSKPAEKPAAADSKSGAADAKPAADAAKPAAKPAADAAKPAAADAAKPAAAKPAAAKPAAAKPAAKAKAKKAEEPVTRRGFLLGLGWATFTAGMAGCGVAMTRFLFPNVLVEPPSEFKVGFPDDFQIGEVDERFKDKFGIWIVRDAAGLYVLSTTCTHLGCTPNWLKTEAKFKCPCHGSGFYQTGINFEGPAPRPLERFGVTMSADGQVRVNKNRILQQEKGQWEDPEAYLKLV